MSDRLPPGVIVEILQRLPIEAVVRCTAVCKSWNSIIKSTSFISSHLERTKNTHLLIFRICNGTTPDSSRRPVEHYSLRFDNEDVDEYKQLHFPFSNRCANTCFRVVGSCNGLVCLADDMSCYVYTFILWNPVIQKTVLAPRPSVTFSSHGPFDAFLGFGFDSKANDYKLLRFVQLDTYPAFEVSVEVEVYSLNANCWKSITDVAPKYAIGVCLPHRRLYGHSFVNGAIHLVACDRNARGHRVRNVILAFDVSEEAFNEIELPECLRNDWLFETEVIKYGESSIAIMTRDGLWVMKEYGVVKSWTRVVDKARRVQRLLAFRRNEEALVTMHGEWVVRTNAERIASHDMNSKHFEYFGVESPQGYSHVDSFVESLVLLDNGKHASGALWNVSYEGPEDDASSGDDSDDRGASKAGTG